MDSELKIYKLNSTNFFFRTRQPKLYYVSLVRDLETKSKFSQCFFLRTRQPKLFYVSSSATTSSVSTTTICFVTGTAAAVTCGKRRKRNILVNGNTEDTAQIDPQRARWESENKTYKKHCVRPHKGSFSNRWVVQHLKDWSWKIYPLDFPHRLMPSAIRLGQEAAGRLLF